MPRSRVTIDNPHDGGFLFWLGKLYLFAALGILFITLHGLGAVYIYFARSVPEVPDLKNYASWAPGITAVVSGDGALLAELANERREVVPISRVPRQLIDAFIATEDRRFFEHGGLDLRGFARAATANLRAGQVMQGGSTITQQVAKAYLSPERTFSRKVREAILARRLEARYSKREILATYLNHIFLGHGTYGVQAAARRYFDRNVWELDLSELALLAGMAKAPTRFSPIDHPSAAQKRRDQVLKNLVEAGFIKEDRVKPFFDQPIALRPWRDTSRDVSPYFVDHIKRELGKQFGQKALYEGGYRIETTVLPYLDVLAADNVDHAVRNLDKRQGFRGKEAHLEGSAREVFIARANALYEAPLLEDTLYLGLVEKVRADGATVRVGPRSLNLPLRNMEWAARYSAHDATNDRTITSAGEALKPGDVIWVRLAHKSHIARFTEFTYDETGDAAWVSETESKPPAGPRSSPWNRGPFQGALYTFDLNTGYVLAMAGGSDYDRSEFNRVVQACRQPGSAYKPIYYSLALDRGYNYDTQWVDKAKAEIDPVTGEMWTPQNVDGSYGAQVTLERALIWSKNPPSVEIFKTLGAKDVAEWARVLGMTTPIHADDALALGASCVRIDEISRAFAIFARNGQPHRHRLCQARPRPPRQGAHRPQRLGRSPARRRGPHRPHGGDGGRAQAPGHPAAHRLADRQAPARRRQGRPLRAHPGHQDHRLGEDRHLQPHLRCLVRRLHLPLADHRLDRRRHLRTAARLQGRFVHPQRPHVGALHVRRQPRRPPARTAPGEARRREAQRSRRPPEARLPPPPRPPRPRWTPPDPPAPARARRPASWAPRPRSRAPWQPPPAS